MAVETPYMNDDPQGPQHLDKLYDHMQNVLMRPQANGRHHPVKHPSEEPNRFCKVCRVVWFKKQVIYDPELKPDVCPKCQKELDEGRIAVTCIDGRHAFIYCDHLVGQQQIMEVSVECMDTVEKRAKGEKIDDNIPPKS